MATAGIVLAGGRSTRMGRSKAHLEWHGSTLLGRVVDVLGGAAGPVVVVRSPGQALPALPAGVRVVDDGAAGRGPLEGLVAGLAAVEGEAEVVYASSTDVPLLHPAFVRCVLGAIGSCDAAVPVVDGVRHPLAAAYRVGLIAVARDLLASGRGSVSALAEGRSVTWLDRAALLADPGVAAGDPGLLSLWNLNEPGDYERARALPA